jgi:hypothetical protein
LSEPAPSSTSGALALGLLSSVGAALPALLRVAPSGNLAASALALVGATSLVVVPLGLWLRRAQAAGWPRADRALATGAALSGLPLALFGGVLKSTTHHRPLGGATFAVAALCLLALCLALSFRFFRGGSGSAVKSTWQNLFTLGCGLSLVATVGLGLAGAARPSLVDFLAIGAAVALTGLLRAPAGLSRPRTAWLAGGWVILLVCAVVSTRGAKVAAELTARAPVSFAALSWLGDGS